MIRRKKTIIALILCLGVLFMTVGYSILMTELKINGSASISSTWDVRITNITKGKAVGSAYNIELPSYTDTTAKFYVSLVNPGDSMTYDVTIENKGSLTAILDTMTITTSGTEAITYNVLGIEEGETLESGEKIIVTVVATYSSGAIADPNTSVKRLKVGLNWVQYTNQAVTDKTYTVKYDANGGTGAMSNTVCTVGKTCKLANNSFTRGDIQFLGWATNKSGNYSYKYTNGETVTNLAEAGETVTLYAIWDILYGDVDCDGDVDEDDSTYLHYYINFPSSYPLTEQGKINADVNLDGVINLDDPVTIQYYLDGQRTLPYTGTFEDE